MMTSYRLTLDDHGPVVLAPEKGTIKALFSLIWERLHIPRKTAEALLDSGKLLAGGGIVVCKTDILLWQKAPAKQERDRKKKRRKAA